MDMRWSLDKLYTSFESDEFTNDLNKCYEKIDNIKKWAELNLVSKDNATKKIEEYINLQIDFYNLFEKLISFGNLTSSVEAKNEKALKTVDKLLVKHTELTKSSVSFQKFLGSLDNIDAIISSSELLTEHSFYIKENASKAKYLLSEKEEILLAKMTTTGSVAWSNLQNMLTSTLMVDITLDNEDKQFPLPVIRNMAYDKNANTRKTAYEAELKAYKQIEESSSACLNGIKGEVITTCNLKGYDSPLEETLLKSRMDRETLDAMFSAMKESFPSFHKYYRRKGELLGHSNGLPFYDLFAPMGTAEMKYTYEEAKDYIIDNFKSFSDKLSNFVDNAFNEKWIDAEQREGKRGGAFCSNLHSIGESRILTNFDGSFSNVSTLAHELGHAYHGFCLTDETILNSDYPMPIAETASIFNETLIMNAALNDATDEEAFTLLEASISDAGQVIVDIYSRFVFETNLFEIRKDHPLSVKELKELMINAQKEAYGDGLDPDSLHPYMWLNKPHYYEAELNFYNFPYAFGLLFSKGLYAEYLKRGDSFIPEYDKLLAATGKNNIADVTKMMGIDIHSVDFWRSSLELIEEDIEKFLKLSEEKK